MIEKRPVEIENRKEPKHWKADTAVWRQGKVAISATIERTSRFLVVKKLKAKTAKNMNRALIDSLQGIPELLSEENRLSIDLSKKLDKIVKKINIRPIKCVGLKMPEEVFVALNHRM